LGQHCAFPAHRVGVTPVARLPTAAIAKFEEPEKILLSRNRETVRSRKPSTFALVQLQACKQEQKQKTSLEEQEDLLENQRANNRCFYTALVLRNKQKGAADIEMCLLEKIGFTALVEVSVLFCS
jgi:hypothetical protein